MKIELMPPSTRRGFERAGHIKEYWHSQGYHFCEEWDALLIGPLDHAEWSCCTCEIRKKIDNKIQDS